MSRFREGARVRILSGDDEGRIGTVTLVRDDGTVIVDLPPVPGQLDIFWGLTAMFEEGLELVDDDLGRETPR